MQKEFPGCALQIRVKCARQTPLNFLVVGDWGQNGLYNQSLVAEQVTWGSLLYVPSE
jgi:hypothetical protein